MHPTTSVGVVLHETPVDSDTGFIAVARKIDGHSAYLLPGTRYEEGDTLTVSVVYDGDGPRTAYGRHGRGSRSREECSTEGVRDWARLVTAATQYLNGLEPTAWAEEAAR